MDAQEWDERYRAAGRLWSATPNLFVSDRLGPSTPGRGLDLACGEGRNSIWLAGRGWDMTGVDFSTVAIERARVVADGLPIRFEVADVTTWEPEEAGFDLVLVAYLQLEASVMESVVRRAVDWLGPGGELFMIGHDISNLDGGYGGPPYPDILWRVPVLGGWLGGLQITEAIVVRRPVESGEGRMYARDALVRGRKVHS